MSRLTLERYLHDNLTDNDISMYSAVVHERPGHKGLVITISPVAKGPPKSYLVKDDRILDCTRSSAKK